MQALATFYRPTTFDGLVEQDCIKKILKQQLATGEIRHCYLFCGPSGDGKTTTARIFANEVNNGVGTPIEIDAASNNGVDNIRSIIQSAKERSVDGKYKIFILDEAHMLTTQSWNALLKLIEEPPAHTIFIFCTTDAQKIPATILNRVQRFDFNRISTDGIEKRLNQICVSEQATNFKESTRYIAQISNGGMRTAIAYLDKCLGLSRNLAIESVIEILGNYSYRAFFEIVNAIIDDNEPVVLEHIENYYNKGNDLKVFIDQFLDFVLDVLKYITFKEFYLIKIPESMKADLDNATNIEKPNTYYLYLVDKLLSIKNTIKGDTNIKTTIEALFLQVCRGL